MDCPNCGEQKHRGLEFQSAHVESTPTEILPPPPLTPPSPEENYSAQLERTPTKGEVRACSSVWKKTPPEIQRVRDHFQKEGSSNISSESLEPIKDDTDWLHTIKEKMSDSDLKLRRVDDKLPIIYKVPKDIRDCDPDAYQPTVVCIGPYNHDWVFNFQLMQHCKWRCVSKLISRREPNQIDIMLDKCLKVMKELEPYVRCCYSAEIREDSNELAEMMMLDGCFILFLLLSQGGSEDLQAFLDRQVIGRLWIWNLVKYDLLLLENQIPFFVVNKLFDLLKTPDDEHLVLTKQALKLFSTLRLHRKVTPLDLSSQNVHHLLHLFYMAIVREPHDYIPNNEVRITMPIPPKLNPDWIPSATELGEAGIKFKKNSNALCFFDIAFRGGVIEIPPLEIHDYSNKLLRNMIAFEQCYPDTQCRITTYVAFMHFLVNKPRDARLLHLDGILTDMTSSCEEPTSFFSKLCEQIHYASDRKYLRSVIVDVSKYYDSKQHKWRASLVRDYFSNPWAIISLGAAVFLLCLTTIQTFFTVYPYYKPSQ